MKRTTLQRNQRKKRNGEYTCLCAIYPFPHRMFGGDCDGGAFVDAYFEQQMYAGCKDCHFRIVEEADYDSRQGGITCQVLDGLEPYIACPELQEFVRYEGIKLTGKTATIMRKK